MLSNSRIFSYLKPKSEFSQNVLTLMTGTAIAQAIPIAISPILTRLYTPADFGVLAIFMAIIGIFGAIMSGRYEMAIMLPKKDEDAINIVALGFIIIVGIALFASLFIALFHQQIVFLFNNDEISIWLYFIPLTLFFTGFFNLLTYYNNRKKHYQEISNATILKSIILSIIQLLVGFIKHGATGLISGQIISTIFANMTLLKIITKDKKLVAKISITKMLALAKKYKDFPKFQVPHAFTGGLSLSAPIYVLSSFFSLSVVGFYSLSTKIIFMPLMIIAGASAKVFNQQITNIYNSKGDSYQFATNVLKSLLKKVLIPFVIVVIFAPIIFELVFGEAWREAGVYTQILSPWILLNVLVSTISYIPSLVNMQKKAFVLSIVHVVFITIALLAGAYFSDIYLSLVLFSITQSLILLYNLQWMLKALKEGKK
jgi:O-antigen/teichoic acid export membrane protein